MDDQINRLRQHLNIVRSNRAQQTLCHEQKMVDMEVKNNVLRDKLTCTSYKLLTEEAINADMFGEYLKRNPGVVSHAILRYVADQKQLEMVKDSCTNSIKMMTHEQMKLVEEEGERNQEKLKEDIKTLRESIKELRRENNKILSDQEKMIQRLSGRAASREAEDSFNKSLLNIWDVCFKKGEVKKARSEDGRKLYGSLASLKFELDFSSRIKPHAAAALTA